MQKLHQDKPSRNFTTTEQTELKISFHVSMEHENDHVINN